MAKFRKRPVVVEAFQWTGGPDQFEDPLWIVEALKDGRVGFSNESGTPALLIATLEGLMVARLGDWIICGTAGEIYPCKPEIFAAIYEPVEGDSEASHAAVLAAKPESSDSEGGEG